MKPKLLFTFLLICMSWHLLRTMNWQISSTNRNIISQLYKYNIVKRNDKEGFLLKDGSCSPIYIDMRMCFPHPKLLSMLAEATINVCTKEYDYDHVCGIPYGAVPLATIIAFKKNKSLLMPRKEEKIYGTKKLIEGAYKPGDRVLVVEDVMTSGSSILEATRVLEQADLVVTKIIVLVDREKGGLKNLESQGYNVTALLTLKQIELYPFKESKL